MRSNYRNFDGKRYVASHSTFNKTNAKQRARVLRTRNMNARIVTSKKDGKSYYIIYTRVKKRQGYNARMDESLGMRRGASRTKRQSMKSRRDESKGMSKSMGRRAYASVRSMDKGRRTRR